MASRMTADAILPSWTSSSSVAVIHVFDLGRERGISYRIPVRSTVHAFAL